MLRTGPEPSLGAVATARYVLSYSIGEDVDILGAAVSAGDLFAQDEGNIAVVVLLFDISL